MFPRGHISEQDETYKSELLSTSPKRQDLQKRRSQSPKVEQTLHRTLQKCLQGPDHNSLDELSMDAACRKADFNRSEENSNSDCQGGLGVLEEEKKMQEEGSDESSSNIVENILKELKGINKIQEEISDLRQYLTSVRGSVDEVSCCVDAVLSEIGELYSGPSAAPHTSPVSQTNRIRRGSLGRQNAITCFHEGDTSQLLNCEGYRNNYGCQSPQMLSKPWQPDIVTLQSDQQTHQEQKLGCTIPDFCYLELRLDHDYQSTSSLSSCHSSSCPGAGFIASDREIYQWLPVDMQHRKSEEGCWSEEDNCSCTNSAEALENCVGVWNKCATEETQSSTLHYNSPSSTSSMLDWKSPTLQSEHEHLECDCATNCPFSRSSGYYTMDACVKEQDSGPSRSPSCSTVLLTDCDDNCLEPHSLCDDCPSSGDTLDLGSAESLDKEWMDHSLSRDEAGESSQGSRESLEMDSQGTPKTPNVGFDVTFSKAVHSFRSALKGALKKLDGSNPESVKDDSGSEAPSSPLRQTGIPKDEQITTEYTGCKIGLMDNHTPTEESKATVYVCHDSTPGNLSLSLHVSPHKENHAPCIHTKCHSVESSKGKGDFSNDGNFLNLDFCPSRLCESPLGPMLSTDEMQLSPIKENHILEKGGEGKPIDASHRERIANFQRILKEKRQTRHRLSKSTQGSQGSHGSQGSQGYQSQDEFIPGMFKDASFRKKPKYWYAV